MPMLLLKQARGFRRKRSGLKSLDPLWEPPLWEQEFRNIDPPRQYDIAHWYFPLVFPTDIAD
jgi:hypothetical protein